VACVRQRTRGGWRGIYIRIHLLCVGSLSESLLFILQ